MAKSPREELLALQKKLWRHNKRVIEESIVVNEAGFDRYEKNYRSAISDFSRVSNQDEMMDGILKSDIIYIGDYHTCNQSQRSFLRILRAAVKKNRRFIVGMELLHERYQRYLDQFLAGDIDEVHFLKKVHLKEHWVFDLWENFKPIFDFCKYHKIPMYAIDSAREGSDVTARDKGSAKIIGKIVAANPKRKLFVFIGDLHLAKQHLPREVERELRAQNIDRSSITLFQNSESIYWRLAEDEVEDYVEVVRLKDGNFCRMHTPPVICQRSYLNWLEHEEGEIDYADAKSSFLEICDRICEFLDIKLGREREEVELFTCGDTSFIKKLKERWDFGKREIKAIERQILASESYYIAKAKIVYLANLSINHAAEEASHFIKSVTSGEEEPRELIDAFYANILHEALGFFGSKLINNRRKCQHEKEFEDTNAYFEREGVPKGRELEAEMASIVIEYKKLERKGRPFARLEIFRTRMDLFIAITHALGYMLGDRLYYALILEKISKSDARALFEDPWIEEGEPVDVYLELVKKLKTVKIPRRM